MTSYQSKMWYDRKWLMIVWMLFCWPVFFYGMHHNTTFSDWARAILIVVLAFMVLMPLGYCISSVTGGGEWTEWFQVQPYARLIPDGAGRVPL